jgi:hypothetical protein
MSSKEIKHLIKHIKNINPGLYSDSNVLIKIIPLYFDDGYNTVWEVFYLDMSDKKVVRKFMGGKYNDIVDIFDMIL